MSTDEIWFIRAGRKAAFVEDFVANGLVAVGWSEMARFPLDVSREELERRYCEAFPDQSKPQRAVGIGQLWRFVREVQVGDAIATYDPDQRIYFVGRVESAPEWRDHALGIVRRVTWTHRVERDRLGASTRNSLGAISTLFRPGVEASDEIWRKSLPIQAGAVATRVEPEPAPAKADEGEAVLRAEVVERSNEFIQDRIARLSWEDLQELVAGILRAMGYKTRVSEPGPDRGVDIFASPDGLGLEEPRIFVEVKHRPGTTMGGKEVRAFLGGRRPGDRCLYVSTGGFSKDAHYEADRSSIPVTLITLPALRQLLVDHYEKLDAITTALVPLERVYWPIE